MARRRGLQTEILVSLGLVLVMAAAVLLTALLRTQQEHVQQLQKLAARSLASEARAELPALSPATPAATWWTVEDEEDGRARPRGHHALPLDAEGAALAREAARRGQPLLRVGPPWRSTWFASPLARRGEVAVARLPAPISGLWLLALLSAIVAVLTAFGAYLLRRRLVLPLQRLDAAARAIADGALEARVPVDGPRETAGLALAFNEMTRSLEERTHSLEKAVADLRESNRSLREARAGLDRAERLAAVGRLAAGVAHEVGNPMGAMLAFIDLAGRDPGLSDAGREHLARCAREAERVRVILRQLLDFSRPRRRSREPVDLVAAFRETAALLSAQRRYAGIAVELAAEPDVPPALADPGAVAQILLNLMLNAADALAGTVAPRIDVRLRARPDRVRAGETPDAAGGRRRCEWVECVVRDNGPGIPAEDRERIFDPFFTTKPPGDGTGLGLSNALRCAEELGGSLELDTACEGPGAVFVLRLPADADAGDVAVRG